MVQLHHKTKRMCKSLPAPVFKELYKNKLIFLFHTLLVFALVFNTASAQAPVDPSSIIGKVVCGYQGWFTCTGDGSPINRWTHWSITTAPQPGVAPNPNPNLTFEAYPDVTSYNPASLFQTNFANLGDGTPARLFSDYKQDVTDKHFELMQANGIDGVAFQRFIYETLVDPAFKANRDSVAVHVRKSAEKYQRLFYVAYDLSGLGTVSAANDQARFDAVKNDWSANMVGNLGITSSFMYAKQGGKPVIQIWGIGYNHVIGTAAIQLDLINWFKAQGCYVIIGVPTGWRTGTGASLTGWINTYNAADMISPWSVGAYTNASSTDNFKTNFLTPDLTYCNTNGIAYQPVIFPGFSWSNWNGGAQNQISRNKGEFLWHQAMNLKGMGITSAEIAMFDEYDEGTAILNIADGYDMIPTNQYFVTSSADGTYLSSDFYLRLAGKLTRVMKGLDVTTATVTIPYSQSPIYFRTSNEAKYDPIAVVSNNTRTGVAAYGLTTGNPACVNLAENPHRGLYALRITGNDRSATTSNAYFNVFDVNIPVNLTTDLNFWTYPLDANGRYISVDLLMTDGTTLRGSGAKDMNGVSMHPATGRGTINMWTRTKCNIGNWLNGKTIDKILIAYDNGPSTGNFSGYIDDISVNDASYSVLPVKLLSFVIWVVKNDVSLQWQATEELNLKNYEIERSTDGIHFSRINILPPLAGTGKKNYAVTDAGVLSNVNNSGQLYYRIKIAGSDGNFSYSKVQTVSIKNKASFINHVFPNPFSDKIEVSVNAEKGDYLCAVITGISGKIFININIKVPRGISKVAIKNLENLPKGIYFLKLTMEEKLVTYKIEK